MKPDLLDSPRRLAAVTCLGGLLTMVSFFGIDGWRRSHHPEIILIALAMVVIGLFGLYWGPSQLREGIRNERWPEASIEPLRRIVEHPAWTVLIVLLLIAMMVFLVVERRFRIYFWETFLLLQTASQLSNSLRRSAQTPGSGGRIDWAQTAPLQSDHWGEH